MIPQQAKVLYLAAELFLWELDHLSTPEWLGNAQREGWNKAVAAIKAVSAEAAMRRACANFVEVLRDELTPDAWQRMYTDFAELAGGVR